MTKSPHGTAVRFASVTRNFRRYTAVRGICLEVRTGSFLSVVGPSGCGKSTLLNIAAGLMQPTEGSVEIFGEPLSSINRNAAYMFQQDALLPWKTVLGNIMLGLEFRDAEPKQAVQSAQGWVLGSGSTVSRTTTRTSSAEACASESPWPRRGSSILP